MRSVSADRGRSQRRRERGGASVSADQGAGPASAAVVPASARTRRCQRQRAVVPASARTGAGPASAAAVRSVSADRGGASVSGGGGSVSADRGDADVGSDRGRKAPAVPTVASGSGRSYDSFGEWFEDLRSMFTGKRKGADVVAKEVNKTITHSSATQTTEASDSGQTQVNRVVQRQSSTEIATGGGSAEARNVSEIEQNN